MDVTYDACEHEGADVNPAMQEQGDADVATRAVRHDHIRCNRLWAEVYPAVPVDEGAWIEANPAMHNVVRADVSPTL